MKRNNTCAFWGFLGCHKNIQAYWLAKQSILDLGILSPGAFWPTSDIGLRMTGYPDFERSS